MSIRSAIVILAVLAAFGFGYVTHRQIVLARATADTSVALEVASQLKVEIEEFQQAGKPLPADVSGFSQKVTRHPWYVANQQKVFYANCQGRVSIQIVCGNAAVITVRPQASIETNWPVR